MPLHGCRGVLAPKALSCLLQHTACDAQAQAWPLESWLEPAHLLGEHAHMKTINSTTAYTRAHIRRGTGRGWHLQHIRFRIHLCTHTHMHGTIMGLHCLANPCASLTLLCCYARTQCNAHHTRAHTPCLWDHMLTAVRARPYVHVQERRGSWRRALCSPSSLCLPLMARSWRACAQQMGLLQLSPGWRTPTSQPWGERVRTKEARAHLSREVPLFGGARTCAACLWMHERASQRSCCGRVLCNAARCAWCEPGQ